MDENSQEPSANHRYPGNSQYSHNNETHRLELTLNPTDGSLSTESLLNVILASTQSLYDDLYTMAHGEVDVTTTAGATSSSNAAGANEDADGAENEGSSKALASTSTSTAPTLSQQTTTRKEQMSNLSFAQRRYELAWRLAQHSKSLQHVAALTATAATSDLARDVEVSSKALQHARASWVQADEAQDALYFFHAQLFPARAPPHDIYGALDVRLHGQWYDLPTDLRLVTDPYSISKESRFSKQETDERWSMAVRDKLVNGEIGLMKKESTLNSVKWKISLSGGTVRLTVGEPKQLGRDSKNVYPIEALLSVLSTEPDAEWTLLSVEVKVQAKVGEFNHQLETSNRQRYDLHRLAALAMAREEARARRENRVSRPLSILFEMSHVFMLSWQLEMFSSQAQALRRGVWAAVSSNPIHVTPVSFYDHQKDELGVVYISFWKVNEDFGRQSLGDLSITGIQDDVTSRENRAPTHQFALSVRAEAKNGIVVSLSGATTLRERMKSNKHIKEAMEKLIAAASSPFGLSASDALLVATQICSEQRCFAVCYALTSRIKELSIPDWIRLETDRDAIKVSVRVMYRGVEESSGYFQVFVLSCDARTGSFVLTFPRCNELLRRLVGNDVTVSEALSFRIGSLKSDRQRSTIAKSTGRYVKERFESLGRAIDSLAQFVGLGSDWDDRDEKSASLRERSITSSCSDAKESLMVCCGISALFSLFPLGMSTSAGLGVSLDRCGEALNIADSIGVLPLPPVGALLTQKRAEKQETMTDGSQNKIHYIQQDFFASGCSVSSDSVTLFPMLIKCETASPTSVVERTSFEIFDFSSIKDSDDHEPPRKRPRRNSGSATDDPQQLGEHNFPSELARFSQILSATMSRFSSPE